MDIYCLLSKTETILLFLVQNRDIFVCLLSKQRHFCLFIVQTETILLFIVQNRDNFLVYCPKRRQFCCLLSKTETILLFFVQNRDNFFVYCRKQRQFWHFSHNRYSEMATLLLWISSLMLYLDFLLICRFLWSLLKIPLGNCILKG